MRLRVLQALAALSVAAAIAVFASANRTRPDGCASYTPVHGYSLVAHAGGGLPDRTYANNLEALDLAASHGFKLVELDFILRGDQVLLGHSQQELSDTSFSELLDWLRQHPDVTVITDAKTDNVATLGRMAELAGPLTPRFVPQIYSPSEYAAVSAFGMQKPIFTVYRTKDGWQDAANRLDLAAVTVSWARKDEAKNIRHPVYLHTVNSPVPGYGLYTDCLIPA